MRLQKDSGNKTHFWRISCFLAVFILAASPDCFAHAIGGTFLMQMAGSCKKDFDTSLQQSRPIPDGNPCVLLVTVNKHARRQRRFIGTRISLYSISQIPPGGVVGNQALVARTVINRSKFALLPFTWNRSMCYFQAYYGTHGNYPIYWISTFESERTLNCDCVGTPCV